MVYSSQVLVAPPLVSWSSLDPSDMARMTLNMDVGLLMVVGCLACFLLDVLWVVVAVVGVEARLGVHLIAEVGLGCYSVGFQGCSHLVLENMVLRVN